MPYPSKEEIERLCSHLSTDQSKFLARVSPDVEWDVLGMFSVHNGLLRKAKPNTTYKRLCSHLHIIGTHPAAGSFKSLEEWKQGALGVVNKVLKEPLKLNLANVAGGGQEWAAVELFAHSQCKNGMPYNQRYTWWLRFNDQGTIVQARAYLDSALVQSAVDANT